MDFAEFECNAPTSNPDVKYSDDVEFVVEQLNYMVHVGGRASRSVQLPVALNIIKTLKEMGALANER
jgi:hypothetical protein